MVIALDEMQMGFKRRPINYVYKNGVDGEVNGYSSDANVIWWVLFFAIDGYLLSGDSFINTVSR